MHTCARIALYICLNKLKKKNKTNKYFPSFQNLSITDKVNITILLLHLKLLSQSNVLKEGNDNQVHSILKFVDAHHMRLWHSTFPQCMYKLFTSIHILYDFRVLNLFSPLKWRYWKLILFRLKQFWHDGFLSSVAFHHIECSFDHSWLN